MDGKCHMPEEYWKNLWERSMGIPTEKMAPPIPPSTSMTAAVSIFYRGNTNYITVNFGKEREVIPPTADNPMTVPIYFHLGYFNARAVADMEHFALIMPCL